MKSSPPKRYILKCFNFFYLEEDNPKCTENASQDEEICWYVNRGAFETEKDSKINVLESYGFANQRSLVFEGMMVSI